MNIRIRLQKSQTNLYDFPIILPVYCKHVLFFTFFSFFNRKTNNPKEKKIKEMRKSEKVRQQREKNFDSNTESKLHMIYVHTRVL